MFKTSKEEEKAAEQLLEAVMEKWQEADGENEEDIQSETVDEMEIYFAGIDELM